MDLLELFRKHQASLKMFDVAARVTRQSPFGILLRFPMLEMCGHSAGLEDLVEKTLTVEKTQTAVAISAGTFWLANLRWRRTPASIEVRYQ